MAQDDASQIAIAVVALVALVGVALAAASLTTRQSMSGMMGGMGMGSTSTADAGPGGFEWAILIGSVAFFLGAIVVLIRARVPSTPQAVQEVPHVTAAPDPSNARRLPPDPEPISELTLVKLLGDDERRMYLDIRDHGGEVLQRDLVAQGTFSKAKVTRVLDRLERKGLVVRERHGMTNRIRLVRTGLAR